MKMTFCGAARMVTGSCCLVETETARFLVDCGLLQGSDADEPENGQAFPFAADKLDFVLLTHAHIDHSGRLPKLYVDGFRGPIHTTRATADLCRIMLPDSGHIQESEAEWCARKNERSGKECLPPLYTMQDAIDVCNQFESVRYDEPFEPAPGIRACLRDAGHILGSSILELDVTERGKTTRIVFSGDLGNRNIPLMRDPKRIESADILVVESTYGDREHAVIADPVDRMIAIISETTARGGTVIIPAFAVGRTQEVIYALNKEEERYRDRRSAFMQTQVYVDSPLATSATEIFRKNADLFDEEAQAYIANGDNPLDFPNLHFTASVDESKALNDNPDPKIIISSSGMADAGRVRHHLKHNLWKSQAAVIFVGYQAPGTLGRLLVDGAKHVRILGEEIVVRARIEMLEGFSGHADCRGLLDWIGAIGRKPDRIILTHGEDGTIDRFAVTIGETFGIPTHIPHFAVPIDPQDATLFKVATTADLDAAGIDREPAIDKVPDHLHATVSAHLADDTARLALRTGRTPVDAARMAGPAARPEAAAPFHGAAGAPRGLPRRAEKAVRALEDDFERIMKGIYRALARAHSPQEKQAVLERARQNLRQAVDAELGQEDGGNGHHGMNGNGHHGNGGNGGRPNGNGHHGNGGRNHGGRYGRGRS